MNLPFLYIANFFLYEQNKNKLRSSYGKFLKKIWIEEFGFPEKFGGTLSPKKSQIKPVSLLLNREYLEIRGGKEHVVPTKGQNQNCKGQRNSVLIFKASRLFNSLWACEMNDKSIAVIHQNTMLLNPILE